VAFLRWTRWSQEEKANGWRLYGWFTGLAALGSVAGALAYGCRVGQLRMFYIVEGLEKSESSASVQDKAAIRAESRRFAAAHFALFPLELFFVVTTQLILLSRMQHFVLAKVRQPQLWMQARRYLLAIITFLNMLGICGNFAASFYYNQAAALSSDAARAYSSNSTRLGDVLRADANQKHSLAGSVASIQRFSEVCSLLVIILVFLIVGFFGVRAIIAALRTLLDAGQKLDSMTDRSSQTDQARDLVQSASAQGRALHLKVTATTTYVFLSLLLRAVFTTLYAVAQALQNNGDPCAPSWCDPCKNVYSNIHGWILYTPSFQNMCMLVASPIAMLVGLWGMSNVRAMEDMSAIRDAKPSLFIEGIQGRPKSLRASDFGFPSSVEKSRGVSFD
jgi:hypothetical protein